MAVPENRKGATAWSIAGNIANVCCAFAEKSSDMIVIDRFAYRSLGDFPYSFRGESA